MLKKFFRTAVIIISCAALLASCMAGAAKTGGDQASPPPAKDTTPAPVVDSTPKVTEPGAYPVYTGDKVTFKIFNSGEDKEWGYDKNSFTKYITDRTGVNFDWTIVTVKPEEKLNLLLASNDKPDIIFHHDKISPEIQMLYGKQGIFIPIEDLLLKNGYYFQKNVLPYTPDIMNAYRMSDGNVYCMPKVMGAYEIMYSQCMIMNQKWLDKLGLKMPTTTADFKKVLQAFKTQDPNGNSKADEIPLIGTTRKDPCIWGFLMFPFIYHDGAKSDMINRDGNDIFPAFTQDGWKEGIKYMADLYAEGLIDPQSFTLTKGDAIRQISEKSDDPVIGAIATKGRQNVINPASPLVFDYEYVPPLEGPSGVRRHMYNPDSSSVGDTFFSVAITDACKYPEIAVRFLDTFYDMDVSMSQQFGVKDEDWRYAKPGEVNGMGEPATWAVINVIFNTTNNRNWDQAGPTFFPWDMRYGQAAVATQQGTDFDPSIAMYKGAKEVYAPFAEVKSHFYDNLLVLPEEVEDAAQLKTDIYDYLNQSMALFITGRKDVDKEWNNYLKDLDKFGLDKWMKLKIDAAKRMYGETLNYRK